MLQRVRSRGWRLSTLLLVYGATLLLPALLAAGLLVARDARLQGEQFDRRAEQVAADLVHDIDRQLMLMTATLSVLAGSLQIANNDLQSFHVSATRALHPLGLELLYRDLDGQQLMNTRVPWGRDLPRSEQAEIDKAVRETMQPHYSDVIVGTVAQRPIVTLTVPVVFGDALRGFLHMSINPERLLDVMKGQNLPPEWNTGITDRKGVIIARLQRHEDFVGKPLPEELRILSRSRQSAFRATNLEGIETVRAARVSPLTGWLISANVPVSIARSAMIATLWSIAGVALALGLLALALAFVLARLIARPIQRIAHAATLLEDDAIPPLLVSPVREANEVAVALRRAAERLHERARTLRETLDRNGVLIRELAHRSKNLLTVVDAIARRTLRTGDTASALDRLSERLGALARLQDLVVSGARGGIELAELVASQLAPFVEEGARLEIDGAPLRLRPEAANALGLALHELATNATKYGALSVPEGSVSISWRLDPGEDGTQRFRMRWRERGGPPVAVPQRRGFGSSVMVDIASTTLKGPASLAYPVDGVEWQVDAPAQIVVE